MISSHHPIYIHEAWRKPALHACLPMALYQNPQCAWLPCPDPDFDRNSPCHIRARPAAANAAVVNDSASVWDPGSTEARGLLLF